jgi:hypothetical protein
MKLRTLRKKPTKLIIHCDNCMFRDCCDISPFGDLKPCQGFDFDDTVTNFR